MSPIQGSDPSAPASFLEWQCETCDDMTVHVVLRERKGKAVLQCDTCQTTVKATVVEEGSLAIPIIISEMDQSRTDIIQLFPDERLAVDDQIFHSEHNLLVTALEVEIQARTGPSRTGPSRSVDASGGKGGPKETHRVPAASATEVSRIWAKVYDRVRVGVAVNRGRITTSGHCWCVPEEEIYVGDDMDMGGETIVVVAIKTESRKLRDGYAQAQAIKRLYCRPLKGHRGHREH